MTQLSQQEIQVWMVRTLSEVLELTPEQIDVVAEFGSYGLDSIKAFNLTGELAEWLDMELSATLFWEHPTIEQLSSHLAEQVAEAS